MSGVGAGGRIIKTFRKNAMKQIASTSSGFDFSLSNVINNSFASSMSSNYCIGYGSPSFGGGFSYIAVPKLSVGKISTDGLDAGTEGIVSYDICEKRDAYIGQINMLTASSFCGINGALWGYHLVENFSEDMDPLATYTPDNPVLPNQSSPINIYPIGCLLDAGVGLFGMMKYEDVGDNVVEEQDDRRFPPFPGSMVTCANKSAVQTGAGYVWSALGIGIAEDRESEANLFIEDCDFMSGANVTEDQVIDTLNTTVTDIAKSIILCGLDQNVTFKYCFAGAKYLQVLDNEVGTALACVAYVQLPPSVVPSTMSTPSDLQNISLNDWQNALGLGSLPDLDDENSKGVGITYALPSSS